MTRLLHCQSIHCQYGRNLALHDVSFSVAAQEWVYILGPSAGGKTTLLRAIAGLEPLVSGEIVLHGELASNHQVRLAPHERGIGILFQEPALWPHLSVLENVALGLGSVVRGRAARRDVAHEWLARLHVSQLATRRPGEISGGEARRVGLAMALARRPRLLLLDEPMANLDLHLREEMMDLLFRLHEECRLTTLCVTHQVEPPMLAGARAIVLEAGTLKFDGMLKALATAPQSPYVQTLAKRVRWLE